MIYIIDKDDTVVATIEQGTPNKKDLAERGERAIIQDTVIPFHEAEYKDGIIVRHIKTKEDLEVEEKYRREESNRRMIEERMRQIAERELKAEGKI
jgi:hypothetical protein